MEVLAMFLAGMSAVGCAVLALQQRRLRRRVRQAEAAAKSAQRRVRALAVLHAEQIAHEALRSAGRTPRLPFRFTSGSGEDLFLFHLFSGAIEGRYIEVGAFDGVTHSVTYPFEALGWTGLLIEPLPARAAACAKARPNSRTVHAALSEPGCPAVITLTQVGQGERSEKMSYVETTDRHRKIMRDRGPRTSIEVPCTTMNALLSEEPPGHPGIDFAVIDVEGGEAALLRGFDLRRHRPRVLVVEDKSDGADTTVRTLVESQGYVCAGRIAENLVLIRADETELIARAGTLVDRPG
ncbi:MAG: FkbM family methyltransferase [Phycisphaerales bacterium]